MMDFLFIWCMKFSSCFFVSVIERSNCIPSVSSRGACLCVEKITLFFCMYLRRGPENSILSCYVYFHFLFTIFGRWIILRV